jgi:hypothetical protein
MLLIARHETAIDSGVGPEYNVFGIGISRVRMSSKIISSSRYYFPADFSWHAYSTSFLFPLKPVIKELVKYFSITPVV